MSIIKLPGFGGRAKSKKTSDSVGVLNAGRIAGTWSERLHGIFECGLDFRDKAILDVGCNMGIIGYEISKCSPSFYHGVDVHEPSIDICKRLFSAISTNSRFNVLDLANLGNLRSEIEDTYDIVLYLAVDQHLRVQNAQAADAVAEYLLMHCSESLLFRGPPESTARFDVIAHQNGFAVSYLSEKVGVVNPLIRYDRA